jgi:KaiC/GvpD/RAD55 family RecA-like ATPase
VTSTAFEERADLPRAVFLNSSTSLFASMDASRVISFLQDRGAKIKAQDGIFIFTLGKGTVAPSYVSRLEEAVDGILELDIHEEQGKVIRRMRVKKLRGQAHLDKWVDFEIDSNSGIVFANSDLAK